MKISVDHVTNSSSESFGTVIVDTIIAIGLAIPFIAVTLGQEASSDLEGSDDMIPEDDWGYQPHPSTNPEDPPGTIIQNNRDGSVTKTLPDGTKGTKMPDGTIYVTSPDGMTGVIEPDGHQKVTMPDGTKVENYTDGTSYAEYTDGTVRVEYPDGTIKQQNPEGERIQVNPDGSFEIREPGEKFTKVYNSDGSVKGAKDDLGSELTIDDQGNIEGTLVFTDGKSMNVKGSPETGFSGSDEDGNHFEVDKDGNLKNLFVKDEHGYLQIKEDGSIKSAGTNKETGDSYELDFDPEKGLNYTDSKGNYIKLDKDGKGSANIKTDEFELKVNEDGSASYKDDQIQMELDKNGRAEARDYEGNYEIYQPNEDGSSSWERGDKDGAQLKATTDSEGNYECTARDGSQLQISKDSDLTIKDQDGNSTTYTKAEIEKMVAEHESKMAENENQPEGGE
jgi:hypothetical protein